MYIAEMSDIEDLQLKLDSILCKQNIDKLIELCSHFAVKDPVDGKSRSKLLRISRNTVEDTFSTANDYFDGDILLHDAISKIRGTPPSVRTVWRRTCSTNGNVNS